MNILRIASAHPDFPEGLRHVHPPPRELFIRGCLPPEGGVAVVGTRRMSFYGRHCAELLAAGLARLDVPVVSGLALGIDGAAHRAALEAGGRTWAVIGSGLDDASIYPRAHLTLARRIVEKGGGVLSEYPPGTPSYKNHFPERNRLIAGLCRAVLVIEAPEKSGAMITARLALEAGRDVWAVPNPITQEGAWGPNRLIRDGATPIAGLEDLRHALGIEEAPSQAALPLAASGPEATVLRALAAEPLTADGIAARTGLGAAEISRLLTAFEIAGRVRTVGGGRYTLYTSP
jgi:DNA processing protein